MRDRIIHGSILGASDFGNSHVGLRQIVMTWPSGSFGVTCRRSQYCWQDTLMYRFDSRLGGFQASNK